MAETEGAYTLDVEEFVHDLLSGLAPLLALFGGQFIKEFLRTSMGWWGHVLLSVGPVGLLTIVVSVIRIAGPKIMKILIGKQVNWLTKLFHAFRPQEERGSIEKELLSSTSDDVCETWSGKEIVRIKGQCPPGMKTLVVTKKNGVLNLIDAYEAGYFPVDGTKKTDEQVREELARVVDAPPNLALNVRDAKRQARETRNLALVSLFFLACAAATPWIASRWLDGTDANRQSLLRGNYFHSAGTVLLTVGIYGCGYVMEAVTAELDLRFQEKTGDSIAAVRLQPSCTVGDQQFPATAIFNPFDNPNIRTSRWAKSNGEFQRSVGCYILCAIVGFIVSLVGLRVHHWVSAVTTLILSILMIVMRAYSRRHLGQDPVTINLRKGH
ncbi:hypothetical protein C8A01DRAFT_19783 [Parachaetomium inaequale]|uniref:Uncharacterized protein n=1 Tax=Parachaetomium inaequale TaxID=2588326 RepID=A0AAN6P7T0_9PEZI|nr:hypothetical protein C8A01DRAFT_19783 [Parachaetomium inaequale]